MNRNPGDSTVKTLRSFLMIAVAFVVISPLVGCVAQRQQPAEQAYIADSQGNVAPAARSALNGSTAPGKQEIIGLYIPFIGTGLAVKAGLEWDGTPTVIQVPVASAPMSVPQNTSTLVPRTVMVPETRTVMVPKTVYDRQVTIPVPQAAPQNQCPSPPPEPIAMVDDDACPDGSCHAKLDR